MKYIAILDSDSELTEDAIKYIAALSGNDLRYAYNLLEISFYYLYFFLYLHT